MKNDLLIVAVLQQICVCYAYHIIRVSEYTQTDRIWIFELEILIVHSMLAYNHDILLYKVHMLIS